MNIDPALADACLRHFYHLDHSNAAVHTAPVRYSPITFRLAEALTAAREGSALVAHVMADRGAYEEDKGR